MRGEGKSTATNSKLTFICSWAAPESASSPFSTQHCGISQMRDLCPSAENKIDKASTKEQKKQHCEEGCSISQIQEETEAEALQAYPITLAHTDTKVCPSQAVHLSVLSICRSILGQLWGCPVTPGRRICQCAHRAPWPEGVGLAVPLHP